jgi:SAM-dependent methyltransferase
MTPKGLLKAVLPLSTRRWLRTQQLRIERALRQLRSRRDVCRLRRKVPVSTDWGRERGQIVDRYFIEKFLADHQADVHGHVLEFADDSYACRFGGANATQVDVLNLTPGGPRTTIVADLARGDDIPSDTFDCIICTQVLQYVYDLHAGIRTLYRILKPGGVVLVTAPGIQQLDRPGMEAWGEFWRFTSLSLRRLFEEAFPKDHVDIKSYGNVLVATALLYGYAVEDLRREDLDYSDPDYEVPITVRAVKPLAAS